jgi:hypothetical protein
MQANHNLEIIDPALLANIHGGAEGWSQGFRDWYRNFHGKYETIKTEFHEAGESLRRGEYRDALRRTGAAAWHTAKEAGLVPPELTKNVGMP